MKARLVPAEQAAPTVTAPTIKPIETRYRGYRFRSRLEARWAVAFDHLGLPWKYEPEGYRLSNGKHYLPDVELEVYDHYRQHHLTITAEVKGDLEHFSGWQTLRRFATEVRPLLILSEIPEPRPGLPAPMFEILSSDSEGLSWLQFQGGSRVWLLVSAAQPGFTGFTVHPYAIAEEAFLAARSARFEHGDHPSTPRKAVS